MEQKRNCAGEDVLLSDGTPNAGYSVGAVLRYNREAIRALPWRLKEWDFYQISDGEKCLQMTIGHASYAGQVCLSLLDICGKRRICDRSVMLALPFLGLGMPRSADERGRLVFNRGDIYMSFSNEGDERLLYFKCSDAEASIRLAPQTKHSIAVNIPFDESPHAFYYNHKISCMSARGFLRVGGDEYVFLEGSYGLLDWGRGVWPFHNEWYWSNGSGRLDGELFGFNLGCGFGNTSSASENIIYFKDGCTKLGAVSIDHGEDFMEPWRLKDEEGRLDLTLSPRWDNYTSTRLLWVDNRCHQVFGSFDGEVTLDSGRKLEVAGIEAFAEHAVNNW